MAEAVGAIIINFDEERVIERLNDSRLAMPLEMVDATGLQAHMLSKPDSVLDRAKRMLMLEKRLAARTAGDGLCLPPGRGVFDSWVYSELADKIPMEQLLDTGLTVRTGQTHVNRWTDDLLRRIEGGRIDLRLLSLSPDHSSERRGRTLISELMLPRGFAPSEAGEAGHSHASPWVFSHVSPRQETDVHGPRRRS